jgi:hypothetical protein
MHKESSLDELQWEFYPRENVSHDSLEKRKKERPMTMAPDRKKRGYWIEIIFLCLLLFLLLGGRSHSARPTGARTADLTPALQRNLNVQPVVLH